MVRFAVIGTNKITDRFLDAAKLCKGFTFAAVYSRSKEKARQFAGKYNVALVYDDLEELAASNAVDAVYVASPNSLHASQAIKMLKGRKHVLCEKTIASNSRELSAMFKTAEENGVILLEAMRSVFDPGFQAIVDNLSKVGMIRRVTFQYCQYSSRYDNFKQGIIENAFNPAFSNGALMDIGVYCIHPLVKLFGLPEKVWGNAIRLSNGVDGAGTIMFNYGAMQGELIYSKITNSKLPSQIQGEKGCMLIKEIPDICEISIIYNDGQQENLFISKCENNMYYEIEEFIRLIQTKSNAKEHNKYSVMQMEFMDEIRKQTGLIFPADK
ncbi:MAG: Gfo/Idh/MocA family oxidoreductase [Pelosinus sp.]|nr:Gfo/Idh/MocA family oxidoreductase [Pelosinus sp.]